MHVRRDLGATALAVFTLGFMLSPAPSFSQLAKGKSKFLGNALTSGLLWPNYTAYWNQVTPGNAGKWGSVEGNQDSYNWGPLDEIYNLAISNNFPFREHCLVWGQQQPTWITSLDSAGQRAQVEEWIRLVGERYGSTSFVDVVNEPFHAPPPYMNAMGGTGKTGWDWVITAFQWGRQYFFPGIKLTLNDYNILQDNSATTNYLRLIDTLRVRGLIDAVGIQGHYFEFKGSGYSYPVSTLKANLQRLTATGLPVYITEFDVNEPVDSVQLQNYQVYFPLFWEEPGVKGITLWGYVQGDMWQQNAYLLRQDGTERPALKWLRKYMSYPLPPLLVSPSGTTGEPRNPVLLWHSSVSATSYRVQVSTNSAFVGTVLDSAVADTLLKIDSLAANARFFWRVSAINDSGASTYSNAAYFMTGDQIVTVEERVESPGEFTLSQNYPNPFNPSTMIAYRVPFTSWISLKVYDVMGREVETLFEGVRQPGNFSVRFEGTGLSSGMYVCRLSSGTTSLSRKIVLVK